MRPLLIIAGLGRCGSSLLTQMVAACGLRCPDTAPHYEPDELRPDFGPLPDQWFEQFDAVKMLHPHRLDWDGDFPAVVVWLDRDRIEQAKSGLKVISAYVAGLKLAPDAVTRLAQQLDSDRTLAIARLRGWPRIEVQFEDLIGSPYATASRIAEFAGTFGVELDAAAMASVAIARGSQCAPDISLELTLQQREESHGDHP